MSLRGYLKNLFGKRKPEGIDDCLKVLDIVDSVLDEQASESERALLTAHIQRCMPCYEQYNLDKSIRELLISRCNHSKVPADLIESIKLQISNSAEL